MGFRTIRNFGYRSKEDDVLSMIAYSKPSCGICILIFKNLHEKNSAICIVNFFLRA